MKRFSLLVIAVLLFAWSAFAQSGTPAQSQTSAGASSSTNVSADKGGVNAQNDTSATASQNTSGQRSGDRKGKDKSQANASGNASGSTSAGVGNGSASAATGSTLNAVLTKSVDSRKAKEGDEITAKTTSVMQAQGERPIPKGTKLIGHVTKADARAKGDSESALGIVFDRAEVAKGREVPMHAVVQALAAVRTNTAAMNDDMGGMPAPPPSSSGGSSAGGGGIVGGAASGVGNTVDRTAGRVGETAGSAVGSASGTVNNTAGSVSTAATSTLNASSQGVMGLPGYRLDAAAANATQGSVITSSGKNVKLDSGTEMVLRVVSE